MQDTHTASAHSEWRHLERIDRTGLSSPVAAADAALGGCGISCSPTYCIVGFVNLHDPKNNCVLDDISPASAHTTAPLLHFVHETQ